MSIVRLQRENTFRQALSAYLADIRNKQQKRDNEDHNIDEKIDIDPEKLVEEYIKYFEKLTCFQEQVLDDIAHCEVTYESDLKPQDRHQATANRIFRYLGLDPAPVETRFRKVTPFDLSEIISNPKEVVDFLSSSPYSKYLSSNANPSERA